MVVFPVLQVKDKINLQKIELKKRSWILSLVKQWRKEVASPPLLVGKDRLDKLLLCLSWAHTTLRVPKELSCDHSPRTTRASIKIQRSNTNIFPCGATHDVPGGHLVVSCPRLLTTKVINLWSLKDWQRLGYVYVGYGGTSTGSSQGQIPFSQALYRCCWRTNLVLEGR